MMSSDINNCEPIYVLYSEPEMCLTQLIYEFITSPRYASLPLQTVIHHIIYLIIDISMSDQKTAVSDVLVSFLLYVQG